MSIYDLKVRDAGNKEVALSGYRDKVLLIVNTATGCGFTPQYKGLEELYEKYKDSGFDILDFPCNQFLNQAPGSNEEIVNFCRVNFGTSFQTFGKIDVNGKNADPLFVYLKQHVESEHEDDEAVGFKKLIKKIAKSIKGQDIKWNFTKFLVDRNGKVVARFAPSFKPEDIDIHIQKLL